MRVSKFRHQVVVLGSIRPQVTLTHALRLTHNIKKLLSWCSHVLARFGQITYYGCTCSRQHIGAELHVVGDGSADA